MAEFPCLRQRACHMLGGHGSCFRLLVPAPAPAPASRQASRQAAEAEVVAAAHSDLRAKRLAHDAASLAFGVARELRREVGPTALAALLLFMGLGIMDMRVAGRVFLQEKTLLQKPSAVQKMQHGRMANSVESLVAC